MNAQFVATITIENKDGKIKNINSIDFDKYGKIFNINAYKNFFINLA